MDERPALDSSYAGSFFIKDTYGYTLFTGYIICPNQLFSKMFVVDDHNDYEPPRWLVFLAVLFVLIILVGGWVWFQIDMYNNSRPQVAPLNEKEISYYPPSWAPGHRRTWRWGADHQDTITCNHATIVMYITKPA